jgi:hypothetical protein
MSDDSDIVSVGGQGELLEPGHTRADLRLIARAARGRWPVSDRMRQAVLSKMAKIVDKDMVEVPGGDGTILVDNDRNQIAAARVIVAIDAINQADEIKAVDVERADAGKPTSVVQHQHAHAHFDFRALAEAQQDGST